MGEHKMKLRLLTVSVLGGLVSFTHAAPPTGGAYASDPQSEYVQDQTSEGISQANSILATCPTRGPMPWSIWVGMWHSLMSPNAIRPRPMRPAVRLKGAVLPPLTPA